MRNPTVDAKDPGFFGWHFHAPFDTSEVKTVAVFFKSNVFRRDLEKQLTEAVIKEIHLRSPYRVVASHEKADSLLTGTIYSDAKNLVVESPTNLPRELNATIIVQTKWTHNPPTDIEGKQIADDDLRNDQLRPRSRRNNPERLQPRHPEHRQANRRYDGAALVQRPGPGITAGRVPVEPFHRIAAIEPLGRADDAPGLPPDRVQA